MRRTRSLAVLVALCLAGCAGPATAPVSGPSAPPASAAPPSASPAEANFQLLVSETVLDPGQEGYSYTSAFIDGQEAGRTPAGPRGSEKRLLLELPPGNRLLRLEHWVQPPGGEWAAAAPERQPRERFVRVEAGFVTRVFLRYSAARAPELVVQREPKGSFRLEP